MDEPWCIFPARMCPASPVTPCPGAPYCMRWCATLGALPLPNQERHSTDLEVEGPGAAAAQVGREHGVQHGQDAPPVGVQGQEAERDEVGDQRVLFRPQKVTSAHSCPCLSSSWFPASWRAQAFDMG